MQKTYVLAVCFTAFVNAAFDDQTLWPYLNDPSDLSNPADLGVVPSDESTRELDQNLFSDDPTNVEGYLNLEPQLSVAGTNHDDDGRLAGLGSPSEPLNLWDPFGFDNKAGPPEPNLAVPPDFPRPDCTPKVLLCCSGKPVVGGLYSKCQWCMFLNSMAKGIRLLEKS